MAYALGLVSLVRAAERWGARSVLNSIGRPVPKGIRKHQVGIRAYLVTHGLHHRNLVQASNLQDLLPDCDDFCRPLISRWAGGQ